MTSTRARALGVAMAGLAVVVAMPLLVFVYSVTDNEPESTPGSSAAYATGLTRVAVADRGNPIWLQGETLSGATLNTQAWRGSVVVVNVWGSWCAPCRAESPDLVRAYEATRDEPVEFVGIDVRDQRAQARAFTTELGIRYPSFFDQDSSLLLLFSGVVPVSAVPSTVILDREGRVAASVVGVIDEATLSGLIEDTLLEDRLAG